MDFRTIFIIARQELIINIRNRWTLVFAAIFCVLSLAISYFGFVTAGAVQFQGFTRTSASLLNLVLYVVPLVALTMGTLSFTSEKSSGELLFSQPVARSEILLGKIAGLFLSIAVSTLLGFGFAGVVIAANTGSEGAEKFPLFVGLSLFLALIFISFSALISMLCRRKAKAFGITLFLWFFFVLFFDLAVIGATFLMKEHTANNFLFLSLFANPVDLIRVASLLVLDGKEVFGAAGAMLLKFLGGKTSSIALLLSALAFWFVVPVYLSQRLLKRQDI